MLQDKINKLIEYQWTTKGIELLPNELKELWKEFSNEFNLDSKAKQVVLNFLNDSRRFQDISDYKQYLKKSNDTLETHFESILLDQLIIIINQLGNNFISTTTLSPNIVKLETFFNFLWYGLFPIFYYKTFKNMILMKQDFLSNLFHELSMNIYGKEVDETSLNLTKLYPSTRVNFIIVGNLLESLNNKG